MKHYRLLGLLAIGFSLSAAPLLAAKVDLVSGDVQVQINGQWKPVTKGMEIPDTAPIKTGANGRLKVILANGTAITVQPGKSGGLNTLAQASGGVNARALNRLGSSAPSSTVSQVAGVRASDAAEDQTTAKTVPMDSSIAGESDAVKAAQAKADAGDLDGAMADLSTFIAANPLATYAHLALANMRFDIEDYTGTIESYRAVVANVPKGVDMESTLWRLMVSEQMTQQYDASNKTAEYAIANYPSSASQARWKLLQAYNYQALGDKVKARAALKDATAKAMMDTTNITTILLQNKDARDKNLRDAMAYDKAIANLYAEHRTILEEAGALAQTLN